MGPDPLGSPEQCENGYNDLLDGTRLLPLLPSKPRPHPPPESLLKVNPLSVLSAGSHYVSARPPAPPSVFSFCYGAKQTAESWLAVHCIGIQTHS